MSLLVLDAGNSIIKVKIARFIEDVYMTKRIHSALGYLPVEGSP